MAKIGWKTKEQIQQDEQANKSPEQVLKERVDDLERRLKILETKLV